MLFLQPFFRYPTIFRVEPKKWVKFFFPAVWHDFVFYVIIVQKAEQRGKLHAEKGSRRDRPSERYHQ